MEKKVIDLEIIDDLEESGTQKISLVDAPAIEKDWMYFKKVEQFVEPKSGESQSDYMSRCVPTIMDEGKDQTQAVAICISTYENMTKVFEFDAFADYPWDKCISDAKDRGLNDESASKLCGWIKANMEAAGFADYPWDECIADRLNEGKSEEAAKNICGWIRSQNMGKMKFAKVSFDFDDTLSTAAGLDLAMKYKEKGDTLYIISARNEVSSGMLKRAEELGIPKSRVYATGSNKAKVEKVLELGIDKHIDNNADVVGELAGKGEKFEINTAGLPAYTQQVDKKKKDLITEPVNFAAILTKARELGFAAEDLTSNGLEFHQDYEGIDLKLAKGYTVYKYQGPITANSRDFCREMVNMDRFYTFDEVNQLSATDPNPGFGLKGADNYSIWKYLGGPNCHHYWQKYYVTEAGAIQNKGKAPGDPGKPMIDRANNGYAFAEVGDLKVGDAVSWKTADQNPRGRIKEITYRSKTVPGTDFKIEGSETDPGYIIEIYEKMDGKWTPTGNFVGRKANSILKNVELWRQSFAAVEDKKELVGAVAIPDMEIFRKDKKGNPYYVRFSKDVIRRMAEKFMREQRLADTNVGHQDVQADTYVFESWIVEHEGDKANTVYGLDVPVGTWVVKARVTNDNVWEAVKAGKLRGFSLEGDFLSKEEYEDYIKNKKMYENLVSLISGL